MSSFHDHFSKKAATYARYRPSYPEALYAFLATLTAQHELAWDCGTGNGQSAISLARYYTTVYATDASEEQLKNAAAHERITYQTESAEHCSLGTARVDLVTVAQAVHWFHFDRFYAEVKRVLKPDGVLAVWAYGLPALSPEIDALLLHFHDHVVGAFWQAENRLIESAYRTIPFPFQEVSCPAFTMRKSLSLPELLGLVESWSAVQKYISAHGENPVPALQAQLAESWPDPEAKRTATWELILRVGRHKAGTEHPI